MINNLLSLNIGGQIFALPLEKIVNLIQKPNTKTEQGDDGLPMLKVEFNGINIPIYNISLYTGKKNTTLLKNGYVVIIETSINNAQKLIGVHIDEMPEVIEVDDYEMFPYPKISETYPCFIAEALICHEGNEITLLDIDCMFNKDKMRLKSNQGQLLLL